MSTTNLLPIKIEFDSHLFTKYQRKKINKIKLYFYNTHVVPEQKSTVMHKKKSMYIVIIL
jgi:hypothetical protein